jgi:hypothetical protein
MISLDTAQALKSAGLVWKPALLDFFGVPDRQMDEKVFVISDVLVTVEMMQGMEVVAFQGASEWALDSLIASEAVWIPTETQLREALEGILLASGRPELRLSSTLSGYLCEFTFGGQHHSFQSSNASDAYVRGLLFVLKEQAAQTGGQDNLS